jgi:hypothetical protein
LYLVGSVVLVALSGCGHSFFQTEEREPWRHEAEAACLKSGAVREGPGVVRISPIDGPGICGADFPLKVSALGSEQAMGFADVPRPPGDIAGARSPVRPPVPWPANQSSAPYSQPASPSYSTAHGPISLQPPGIDDEVEPDPRGASGTPYPQANSYPANSYPPDRSSSDSYPPPRRSAVSPDYDRGPAQQAPLPSLGPTRVAAVGPVTLKPAAKLACPIVSVLDQWVTQSVQPAALRWFGQPVVEMKQISAYSCRGMNGNPHAKISEHAFGNALDIAAFILADGRTITVQHGWKASPEEQGFLRDVQGAACQDFTTVLAPGANVYHYNHIHVDLMRHAKGRHICEPRAMSGEVAAARAAQKQGVAARRFDPPYTGSIEKHASAKMLQYSDEPKEEYLDR